MRYRFEINVKPCVHFGTHSAEVSVTNEEYTGSEGKGIVVHQKHISTHDTNEQAEKAAEEFCLALRKKLEDVCKNHCAGLPNAKP